MNYPSAVQPSDQRAAGLETRSFPGDMVSRYQGVQPDAVSISPEAQQALDGAAGSGGVAAASGVAAQSVPGSGTSTRAVPNSAQGIANAAKAAVETAEAARKKVDSQQKSFDLKYQKAYFAVDDKDNVVIRVVDSKGKVLRQIPPEEYLKMAETMKTTSDHLFRTKV